jgi:hypothetical protein
MQRAVLMCRSQRHGAEAKQQRATTLPWMNRYRLTIASGQPHSTTNTEMLTSNTNPEVLTSDKVQGSGSLQVAFMLAHISLHSGTRREIAAANVRE